ncbi:MAG: SH3 domain-containing protein, partial [Anaerolineae bacterium]|nr:SH3 domain-containing protein [Anaerolineae bacterium]
LTWDPPSAQNPVLSAAEGGGPATGGGGGGVPTGITATVNISTLNLRSEPSLSAPVLTKLSNGASYPATGRTGDNLWVQLLVDSTTGWVWAQYVNLSGDINALPVVDTGQGQPFSPQPTGVIGMVMGNLRIRAEPTTGSPQIGLMPWGTETDIMGKNGTLDWYIVHYDGVTGWAYAPWIRIITGTLDQVPFADGTEPTYNPPPATQGVIAQAFGNMRIRSGPGFTFPKIGKAIWGSRVEVLGWSTNQLWIKIRHGDVVGWSYLAWYRIVQGDLADVPTTDQ